MPKDMMKIIQNKMKSMPLKQKKYDIIKWFKIILFYYSLKIYVKQNIIVLYNK